MFFYIQNKENIIFFTSRDSWIKPTLKLHNKSENVLRSLFDREEINI